MRIIIATSQVPFVQGGAEIHAESLRQALTARGHEAEIVAIPFKWYPAEKILDHILACRLLDLTEATGHRIDRVIGLKFPAYHIPHPNKVLWILHQHRSAFDLWQAPLSDLPNFANGRELREAIASLESRLLSEAQAIFANSHNVAQRLKVHSGWDSEPLYHPPRNAEKFTCASAEDYLYFPSRIGALKRQALVVEALAHCRQPVRVVFSGKPEEPGVLEQIQERSRQLKVEGRIRWLGRVSDEDMLQAYARCRAVIFPPVDEDYGYITLEGFLASKPVITCTDSGGPLEFVIDGQNGLVTEPTPEALARAFDRVWTDPAEAAAFGRAGRQRILDLNISWDHVVSRLLA